MDAIDLAGKQALKFLRNQLKRNNGVFMQGERAAGVLGLLAGSKAYEKEKKHSRLLNGKGGQLLEISVAIDFLMQIQEIKRRNPKSLNPLEHMDYTSLIQYMGVVRAYCLDHKNYYGFDLYNEVERRLKNKYDPLDGGLILALCNTKYPVENEILAKFLNGTVKELPSSPFYVAEISLKLLATICMDKKMSGEQKLQDIKLELSSKLEEYFSRTGGFFGGFIDSALATQPLNSVNSLTEVYFHSIPNLIHMQKADGSFGSSVPFTSIALPSITHITPSELNLIDCSAKEKGRISNPGLIFSYVIQDTVITDQRSTNHFYVPNGAKFISAMKEHSRVNPHTFKLQIDEEGIVTKIVSWNNIKNKENLQAYWKVERDTGNGILHDITEKLDAEALYNDTRYVMSFVTVE